MTISELTKKKRKGNYDFYDAMDLQQFEKFAELTGFDTGVDIELLYPHIQHAKVLVEFGSGYGRAIKFLLQKGFEGKLVGVERIQSLVDRLKKLYEAEKVSFVHQDIAELNLPIKADAIVWLWSGILELTPEDQQEAISRAYHLLQDGGQFVVESPHKTIKVVGELNDERKIVVKTDWGVLEAYLPIEEEIRNYASNAGFSSVEVQYYQSSTQLDRVFYILRK